MMIRTGNRTPKYSSRFDGTWDDATDGIRASELKKGMDCRTVLVSRDQDDLFEVRLDLYGIENFLSSFVSPFWAPLFFILKILQTVFSQLLTDGL